MMQESSGYRGGLRSGCVDFGIGEVGGAVWVRACCVGDVPRRRRYFAWGVCGNDFDRFMCF